MMPNEIVNNTVGYCLVLLDVLNVHFVIGPLHPAAGLAVTVDENEAIHHLGPPLGQSDKNIGTQTHTEAHAVGQSVVVAYILDHLITKHT